MTVAVITIPRDPTQIQAAHDFHLANVGEFLLPRTIKQFAELAADGDVWIAMVGGTIVACCYVVREDGKPDAEFGGIVATDAHRGQGIASALGTVAIASHVLNDTPARIIAHVHVENEKPIPLLTRLGFARLDTEPAVMSKAKIEAELGRPINMRADESGMIRGHTYVFSAGALIGFADRIENGSLAQIQVQIVGAYYFERESLKATVDTLRAIAASFGGAAPGS